MTIESEPDAPQPVSTDDEQNLRGRLKSPKVAHAARTTTYGALQAFGVPLVVSDSLGKMPNVVTPPLLTHGNAGSAITDNLLHLAYVGIPIGAEVLGTLFMIFGGLKLIWNLAPTGNRSATDVTAAAAQDPASKTAAEGVPKPATEAKPAESVWQLAIQRHDALKDTYANLICDPIAALDHSALLDIHNTRSAAFVDMFGKCQDLRSIYAPNDQEPSAAIVADYSASVRKAWALWDDAVRYAARIGNDWLPEAEQAAARKAAALLKVAGNDGATAEERALAALRAHEQLGEITSFTLPDPALEAIAYIQRPQVGVEGGR